MFKREAQSTWFSAKTFFAAMRFERKATLFTWFHGCSLPNTAMIVKEQ